MAFLSAIGIILFTIIIIFWTDHVHITLFGVRSKCHIDKVILKTSFSTQGSYIWIFFFFDYKIYILQNGNELVKFKLVYMTFFFVFPLHSVLMYVKMAAIAVILP